MIRMLQMSLLLSRLVQRSSVVATSNPAFVCQRQHLHSCTKLKLGQGLQYRQASHVALSASASDADYNDDASPGRKSSGVRRKFQSPLMSFHQDMFADDSTTENKSSPEEKQIISRGANSANSEQTQGQSYEFDNDYPQDIIPDNHYHQFDSTSSAGPPQPAPLKSSFAPPPRPPPQSRNSASAPPSRQFPQTSQKTPPVAAPSASKMRRPPPPAYEYDFSHYDAEFGAVRPEENMYVEYHEGMIEEYEAIKKDKGDPHHDSIDLGDEKVEVVESVTKTIETTTEVRSDSEGLKVDAIEATTEVRSDSEGLKVDAIATVDFLSTKEADNNSDTPAPQKSKSFPASNVPPQAQPQRLQVAYSAEQISFMKASSGGTAQTSSLSILELQVERIQSEIYRLNDGEKFNINSPKQVSQVLFGVDNESTNKAALEALTGNISNTDGKAQLASLILKYRKATRDINKIHKQKENEANGTHVGSINSMRNSQSDRNGNDNGNGDSKKIGKVSPMETADGKREPLVLVDASAFIFRAYYSMPPIHRPDGEPTGATLGFCNMMNRLILTPLLRGERPRIILVFDSKDGTNFRKKMYPEYKSNRDACPDDLIPQFDFVRDAADAYGVLQLEAAGYEADDVIATLSTMAVREGCHVNILSGDKDLMQLVTKDDGGACVEMIDPMKMVRFCHDAVIEKWGVEPMQLGDVLALAGDKADNIPGVAGIGPKIASSLIQEYGSLEELLERVSDVKQKGRREKLQEQREMALLSRSLVELERNIQLQEMSFPMDVESISEIRAETFDHERLFKFYDRMGFRDLKKRVGSRLPNGGRRARTDDNDTPKTSGTPAAISLSERYSSILDPSSKARKGTYEWNDSAYETGGARTFSARRRFKAPPKPEDFSDVPF